MFAGVLTYHSQTKRSSSPIVPGPEVRDQFDDRKYPTWEVGDLQWLARNIYRDVPVGWLPEDNRFASDGRVYTWKQALWIATNFGDGWRLPTDEDWEALRQRINHDSDCSAMKLNRGHWRGWLGNAYSCHWQGAFWSIDDWDSHHASVHFFNHHRTSSFRGYQRNAYAVRLVRERVL